MKCGVITFHRAINFGAVLQTYALNKVINDLGVDCEVIDYYCTTLEKQYKPLSIKSLIELKKMASILLKNAQVKDNRKSFDDFSKRYIKFSREKFYSNKDLINCNKNYDIFIAGSDQVWSYYCAGFDTAYFLDFVKDNHKKNSYAASFGVESIPNQYISKYNELLKDFNNISVREEQGAEIVKSITKREATVVLDPTLLVTKEQWNEISPENNQSEKYILVYLLAETKSIFKFAKTLAKDKNLKIVYIHDRLFNKGGVKNLNKVSPDRWVSLFINAEYIVTNSFHGVAFSINLEKEFYMEYLPEPAKVNSRLENILKVFNLNNRCINDNISSFNEKIDYKTVSKLVQYEREKSINYLSNEILSIDNNKK